ICCSEKEQSMNMKKLILAGLLIAAAATSAILAQGGGQRGAQVPIPTYKSEEYLLLGNAMRGAGEPMVAVDPSDPKNMIVVATGNLHQPEGKPVTTNATEVFHHITKSTITWLAQSHDGGLNWDI